MEKTTEFTEGTEKNYNSVLSVSSVVDYPCFDLITELAKDAGLDCTAGGTCGRGAHTIIDSQVVRLTKNGE